MSKKEEHITKKIIETLDLDKPSVNFTDNIMSKVNALEDEIHKDVRLTSLLKKNSIESPVANFSSNVMAKINAVSSIAYRPLIGKRAWVAIFLFFASFTGYLLFSKPKGASDNVYLSKFLSGFEKLFSGFGSSLAETTKIPSILIVSILCLSMLLLLDSLLKTKKFSI